MISASRSASAPASGSCSRTPSSSGAGRGGRAQCVGVAALARQRLARLLGGGAERVGVAQPRLVGGSAVHPHRAWGRRPRSRRGRTAAGRPPGPARGRWPRPRRARARWPRAGRAGRRTPPPGPARGSPPNRSSASRWARWRSSRCWSDWPCTATSGSATSASLDTGTEAPPTQARDRPSARDVAGQHDVAVLDLAAGLVDRRAEPVEPVGVDHTLDPRLRAPVRTMPLSARPPSSSPSAVTTIVLPAPVSPVITVSPGPSSSRRGLDHAQLADPDLLEHQPTVAFGERSVGRASPGPAGRTWPPAGR